MAKRTTLKKLADKARPPSPDDLPDSDNPVEVLRLLVRQHRARDREIRRRDCASREFILLRDGTKRESPLPAEDRAAAAEEKAAATARQMRCRKAMLRELKRIPIYEHFLSRVAGMGPVLSAYLVSLVDIRVATKPSGLKRFCGAVPDKETGRLEKPGALSKAELTENAARIKRGERPIPGRHYCQDIRTELFKWQGQLTKEGVRDGAMARGCKYLESWLDFKRGREEEPGKGHRKGAWRATGIMLDDLYMVWRALEGLPVWPDWYAAKLGYSHGGKICVREPKQITLDVALELVGDPGWLGPRVPKAPGEEPAESGVGLVDSAEDEDDLAAKYMTAKSAQA